MSDFNLHNLASIKHVVAVAAGKGGVGKSTLSLNLALYLQKKGFKVGLMDADLYGPSLKKMLPEEIPVAQHPIAQERILPAQCKGIKVVSMAHFLADSSPTSARAPIVNGIIKQFIHLVDWEELDFLFIDFPPGTGDIQLTLIQEGMLSGAILVTTPQQIALLDVAKAMEMFRQMQVPLVGLVENMSYFSTENGQIFSPFGKGEAEAFTLLHGLYFLGKIPIEAEISRCCDQGICIFDEAPEGPAVRALSQIAERVREQLEAFGQLNGTQLKSFDVQWKK